MPSRAKKSPRRLRSEGEKATETGRRRRRGGDRDGARKKGERRRGACVVGFGKPRRNDAGLRVKIRRLSWLVAETAVSVYLNMPRPRPHPTAPPGGPRRPEGPRDALLCHFLMSGRPATPKRTPWPEERGRRVPPFCAAPFGGSWGAVSMDWSLSRACDHRGRSS